MGERLAGQTYWPQLPFLDLNLWFISSPLTLYITEISQRFLIFWLPDKLSCQTTCSNFGFRIYGQWL